MLYDVTALSPSLNGKLLKRKRVADSERAGEIVLNFLRINRLVNSQAGRRGFESHLPLQFQRPRGPPTDAFLSATADIAPAVMKFVTANVFFNSGRCRIIRR